MICYFIKNHNRFILTAVCLCMSWFARAQYDSLSSDDLFQAARKAAFDYKNYPLAIQLSKLALTKSPNYSDIRIFLGRVYTWSDQPDSAREAFQYVLSQNPSYEETYIAITDLEYWNDQHSTALDYVNKGLSYHPSSEPLLLRKAKVLASLKRLPEAATVANQLLTINPNNADGRAVLNSIKDQVRKNKIDVSYDYTYFDKRFDQGWHLASISYSRQTNIGSVIGRFNYGNRFGENGIQGEVEAYPRISNTFYSYVGLGYSDSDIFPRYRAGFSLYANLPKSFEGEVGFRYLYFSDPTWIYTASVGKYYKSYWFNLRTYLTPGEGNLSKSFSFTTRYYTKGADDYITGGIGYGISPDDRKNNINFGLDDNLKAYRLNLGYQRSFNRQNIIGINGTWFYEEYLPKTYGNQINIGISLQRRF